MPLFIDGYNLAFRAGYDKTQPEAAREKLLALLAKFQSARPGRIVAFFDGGPMAAHLPRSQQARGIEVRFSEGNSDADTDIKAAVAHDPEPRGVRVVTSDAEVSRFVERYGARVTGSAEFLREMQETLEESSLPEDEPLEKYEGSAGEDAEFWLREFGGADEDGGKDRD